MNEKLQSETVRIAYDQAAFEGYVPNLGNGDEEALVIIEIPGRGRAVMLLADLEYACERIRHGLLAVSE